MNKIHQEQDFSPICYEYWMAKESKHFCFSISSVNARVLW